MEDVPNRWWDGHMVRWIGPVLHPVGGNTKQSVSGAFAFASKVRAIHQWQDNSGVIWLGVLCELNVYVISGGTSTEITPTTFTGPPADLAQGGYGDNTYSLNTYGTPRPNRPITRSIGPAWTLDNFGQILLVMSSYDGRLLSWDPSSAPGTKLAPVANAPVGNRTFIVTPEGFVVLYQYAGVPHQLGWCDQGNITNWTPGITSLAETAVIQPASPIICARKTRYGTLFFTARGSFFSRYLGTPYVYSVERVSDGDVPLSAASLTSYGGVAIWPSEDNFYVFDGTNVSPINCDLLDYLKGSADPIYVRYRGFGVNLLTQSEIWWGYPSVGQQECDRFIIYNFKDQWWSRAQQIPRTCGFSGTYTSYPLFSDGSNIIEHENGNFFLDVGMPLPYISSGSLNFRDGGMITTLNKMVPNHGRSPASVNYSFQSWLQRVDGTKVINTVPPKAVDPDGLLRFSITGRDIQMMIQQAANGVPPWKIGKMLMNVTARGKL